MNKYKIKCRKDSEIVFLKIKANDESEAIHKAMKLTDVDEILEVSEFKIDKYLNVGAGSSFAYII